jgi:cell division septation protein DedD
MFLQVFSARDLESAQKVYMQMRAKGHLAILDNLEPEYFRIVIGPFPTRQAADEYLQRLRGDGIESFLRRF